MSRRPGATSQVTGHQFGVLRSMAGGKQLLACWRQGPLGPVKLCMLGDDLIRAVTVEKLTSLGFIREGKEFTYQGQTFRAFELTPAGLQAIKR